MVASDSSIIFKRSKLSTSSTRSPEASWNEDAGRGSLFATAAGFSGKHVEHRERPHPVSAPAFFLSTTFFFDECVGDITVDLGFRCRLGDT